MKNDFLKCIFCDTKVTEMGRFTLEDKKHCWCSHDVL